MTNPAVSKSLTRSGPLELSAQGAFGGVAILLSQFSNSVASIPTLQPQPGQV